MHSVGKTRDFGILNFMVFKVHKEINAVVLLSEILCIQEHEKLTTDF
jgi:hypothetical protein